MEIRMEREWVAQKKSLPHRKTKKQGRDKCCWPPKTTRKLQKKAKIYEERRCMCVLKAQCERKAYSTCFANSKSDWTLLQDLLLLQIFALALNEHRVLISC